MCYKCVLIGDGGTGKTAFIKRLLTGEFLTTYEATLGYEIHRITFNTTANAAPVLTFEMWDIAGQCGAGTLMQEIIGGADCAIIMFDVTSKITFKNIWNWYRDVGHQCKRAVPIVICGNKVDMPHHKIGESSIAKMLDRMENAKYYNISVKGPKNIEKPMIWLAQRLLHEPKLRFSEAPAPMPPEKPVKLPRKALKRVRRSLHKVAQVPLPPENDADL